MGYKMEDIIRIQGSLLVKMKDGHMMNVFVDVVNPGNLSMAMLIAVQKACLEEEIERLRSKTE